MKQALFGSIGVVAVAIGCGGAAVPQDRLVSSQAAIRAAEVGGADRDPQATLMVKKSKDQVSTAKKLIEKGENHRAKMVLMSAEADAELALALAEELSMRQEAQAARKQVQELQQGQGDQ